MENWSQHIATEECLHLARELDIPLSIAALLRERGFMDRDSAASFFFPRLNDLPSPFLMKGMEKAVDMILETYKTQGLILIHGDYDVDGISGSALLAQFFHSLGVETISYQPNRLTEGYGLQKSFIQKHGQKNEKNVLLITVDCGISSHDEVQFAKEKGLKVIITDHHQPPDTLPDADAILNPQMSDCAFPYKELAGVGVAFFLVMGIRNKLVSDNLLSKEKAPKLKELLSLVALGTVADVMSLTGVNRILARAGLEVMEKRSIPWVWALCEQAGLKEGPVTAEDISYRLAPRLNAPGRLGKPEIAFQFLTCTDTVTALELSQMLENTNNHRRQLEAEAIENIFNECTKQSEKGLSGLVVHGSYHSGIIGIIASRIVDMFNKPAILFTEDAADSSVLKGSGRSIENLNLYEILKNCSDILIQYGGHAMAAGLTIRKEDLADFIGLFNKAVDDESSKSDIREHDRSKHFLIVSEQDLLDQRFRYYFELMEPFGNGNPEPVFLLKEMKMNRTKAFKEHLRYFINLNGKTFRGIGFGMADKLKMVQSNSVNLLFKIKKNVYRGEEYLELHAIDMQPSA